MKKKGHKRGHKNPQGKPITKADLERVKSLRKKGMTLKKAAKSVGASVGGVWSASKKKHFSIKMGKARKGKKSVSTTKAPVGIRGLGTQVTKLAETKGKSKGKHKGKGKQGHTKLSRFATIRVPGKTQIVKVPGKTTLVKVPGKTQIIKVRVNPSRKQNALVKTGATIGALLVTRGIGNLIRMIVLRCSLPTGKSIADANEAVKTPEGTKKFLELYGDSKVQRFIFANADLISQGAAFVIATVPLTAKPIKKMVRNIPVVNMTVPYFTAGAGLNVALAVVSKVLKTNQINKLGTIVQQNVPKLGTIVNGRFPLGKVGMNTVFNPLGKGSGLGTIQKNVTPGTIFNNANSGEWDPDKPGE